MGERAIAGRSGRRPYEDASAAELVAGLRAENRHAYHEFYRRLAPALHAQARRLLVPREDRWAIVAQLLDDLLLRLTRFRMPVRKSLEDLAVVALRTAVLLERRTDAKHRRLQAEHATELEEDAQSVLASCVSQATIRAARDPLVALIIAEDGRGEADGDPVRALGQALMRELDVVDVQLLEWSSECVPQRTMAEWLGVTHGAVRNRLSKTRLGLRHAALRYAAGLQGSERSRVERFIARATMDDARIRPAATERVDDANGGLAPDDDAA